MGGALLIGSKFPTLSCAHKGHVSAPKCLEALAKAEHEQGLTFAVQRLATRKKVRPHPGNLILCFTGTSLLFEEISAANQKDMKSKRQASEFTEEEQKLFQRHSQGNSTFHKQK